MTRVCPLAVLVALASCRATAPAVSPVVLPRTEVFSLTSPPGVEYRLAVSLPRDYATSAERYPVLYVLDPEFGFAVARNTVEHLVDRHHLPPLIIIGIGYPGGIEGDGWLRRYRLERTRDYTPTRSSVGYGDGVQDVSGAADAFADFIEQRLVPEVDRRYRTSTDRTLVGHSYGALFGAYVSLRQPALFGRAVLVSPSLWYDQRFIFGYLEGKVPRARLFLAAGANENVVADGAIATDVPRFGQLLRDACPSCGVDWNIFEQESHDSVFPAALTRGLLDVFAAPADAGVNSAKSQRSEGG